MGKEETNHVVRGALILTIAGLLSKMLSATYRIPLQNLTGDLGFYIYQQVYPLLGTVMVLSLYGFPVAISKLTAEMRLENKALTFASFYGPLLTILMIINASLSAILYILAPNIASWIGDEGLIRAFRLAAFVFLLIPFLALLRGTSQGYGMMKPTAYSQVVEQLIRVAIIIVASYLIFVGRLDIYQISEAGVLATLAGGIAAIILLVLYQPKEKLLPAGSEVSGDIPWKYYITTCLTLGVLATFSHLILLLMQIVDMLTLVPSLVKFGLPPIAAMEAKGIFDRGQPLIQFGVVFGSSFALALIPHVRGKQATNWQAQAESIREALLFGFYLALGATVGLFLLMRETNILLFTNSDGTTSLQILAWTIVLTSITITGAVVLQSLGHISWVVYLIVSAICLKVVLNMTLVPLLDIRGSAIATVISMLLLCVTMMLLLHKKLPEVKFFQHIRWRPLLIACGGMILYIVCVQYIWNGWMLSTRSMLLIYMMFVVSTGGLVYLLLLLRYNVLTNKQIQALPFARKMITIKEKVQKRKGSW